MNLEEQAELKRISNLGLSVERLKNNPDFRALMQDLSVHRPAYLTKLISGVVKSEKSTDNIFEELKALSFFQSYLNTLIPNGNSATESLEQEEN